MLEFNSVTKVFKSDFFKKPVVAVNDLSFKVDAGSIVGFLGANGAGKTTSLKMAMDFTRATSGEVHFEGLGQTKNEIFKNIGFLPERPYFYPHLSGRAFCHYMGKLVDMKKVDIEKQISYWAPKLRIDFALDREIKTYSKGMLQRIGFLTALLHDPKLIILDEPLSGVDPIGRKELKDIIVEINKLGKTVFFSSHIVSDVEEICDKVIFLKDGKLVYQGRVDDIINKNLKPVTRIRYTLNNETLVSKVENDNKTAKLKELIESNADIISIEQDKPTLENIFYNVGS
ncbi:MAG: ABC transporter ATP-binding protein [Bacteriovoracaceae bacterium]|nr:ABC transporter ATP-binding protein [Bacteriovoracaceae bacterium]